jgi:penicillin-binding protein 1A
MSTLKQLFGNIGRLFFFLFMCAIFATIAVFAVIHHYSQELPSSEKLATYQPKTMTRLYDSKGGLLSEYAEEKRVFTPIERIPDVVKQAFIAAEDQNFYHHEGIDYMGIVRAALQNLKVKVTGQGNVSGASTIPQQVVKNLLLTKEKTFERKIKEAILAVRISKALSKDRILELYLNEIFLGNHAYGVGAAAQIYFGKTIEQLDAADAALLAAMPKAPSAFNPYRNYKRAKIRRDWVLERMEEEDFINSDKLEKLLKTEIAIVPIVRQAQVTDYFSEEVRRILIKKLGEEQLYGGGLFVRTTLDPKLQKYAEKALYNGIRNYDREHGWRGPIAKIATHDLDIWRETLSEIKEPDALGKWKMAVVLGINADSAEIGLVDGTKAQLAFANMQWAKKHIKDQRWGASPRTPRDVVTVGDVIAVSKQGSVKEKNIHYALEQIPDVNGALMVMDPETGRVLAMVGGYPYGDSHFNRATQAKRQPGSAFKPFVYLTAMENGFNPSNVIIDGPIAIDTGVGGGGIWRPKNYSNDYLGALSLRKGLAKSRNNMTILLTLMLGIDKVQEVSKRLGIYDDPMPYYPMALGAQETTLAKLTAAYSSLDNSGKKVTPQFIDRVQNNLGETIFRNEESVCIGCDSDSDEQLPVVETKSEQIIDPVVAYQVTSMLEAVVQSGTAMRAKSLGKPLAGKTGTTNESFDTWFMGYSPDLVVGTYIGFDQPRTLGAKSTGSSVALPVFIEFMSKALANTPAKPFKVPSGVKYTKIDISTGGAPNELSLPQNIQYEVVNPNAKPLKYSEGYKNYVGGGKTTLDSADDAKSLEDDSFFGGIY